MLIALLLAAGLSASAAPSAPLDLVVVDLTSLAPARLAPEFGFLASSGAVFDAAFAQSDRPESNLASILTSEYAGAHGVLGPEMTIGTETAVLPAILEKEGYATAAFETGPVAAAGRAAGFGGRKEETTAAETVKDARSWLEEKRGQRFFLFLRAGGSAAEPLRSFWKDLKRDGLLSRTVVILVAESGEAGGAGLSDRVLRAPLVVVAPGVRPHHVARTVSEIDAAPTALTLMGLPIPPEFEGTERSALALSTAPAGSGGASFGVAIADGAIAAYSVRDGAWKLVYEKISGRFRLFDLTRDPNEAVDASEREPEKALNLTQQLFRHIRNTRSRPEKTLPVPSEVIQRLRERGYW